MHNNGQNYHGSVVSVVHSNGLKLPITRYVTTARDHMIVARSDATASFQEWRTTNQLIVIIDRQV